MQNLSRFTMVGCLLVGLASCDDGGEATDGTAGANTSGGGGMAGAAVEVGTQVTWTSTGFLGGNAFDITGSWYSYDDCVDAAGMTCTVRDGSLTGSDTKTGWAVMGEGETSKVCAKGVATEVANADSYGKQWGFGLAFDLSNPGGGAAKGPYNSTAHVIKGFSFTITGTAPPKIRINLPMAEVDTATFFREVSVPSTAAQNQVLFNDSLNFKQGPWVAMQTPQLVKPFNPAQIYAIQFQVFTKLVDKTPFDFCVSNFRVIQ